jgi:acyl-coenzyme A thioesterase PaaI-like protein
VSDRNLLVGGSTQSFGAGKGDAWVLKLDRSGKVLCVLSVELEVNLMKPAAGEHFRAVGKVIRAGRTLSVCAAEVQARISRG